jgi:hypothetical protein
LVFENAESALLMTPAKAPFCSDFAKLAGEPLHATVKPVPVWLLIEHRGRWECDALATLPEAVRAHITAVKASTPRMRTVLIRQPGRRSGPLAVFVARAGEAASGWEQFEIERYEDLLAIDIGISGSGSGNRQLFAVCTHGAHDLCCAKYGNAVFEAMDRLAPEAVWQASHLGGCRFAPNVLCLPHGLVYGRVEPEHARAIIESYQAGAVDLSRLRGRSSYSKAVQAADHFVRISSRTAGIEELQLLESAEMHPGCWRVVFRSGPSAEHHEVVVSVEASSCATYQSCSAAAVSVRSSFHVKENHDGVRRSSEGI